MALMHFCGFEDNSGQEITLTGANTTIQTSGQRTGTYYLRIGGYVATSGWTLPVNKDELYFQFAVKVINTPDNDVCFFRWMDVTGAVMGGFWILSGGTFKVYVGDKVTLVGTTSGALSTSWAVVEGYIKISDDSQTGRVVIKLNGITEVDYTGDTKPGTASVVWTMRGTGIASASNWYIGYDDIIINDATGDSFNSWPMGIKIHKLAAPTQNGNYAQYTPSLLPILKAASSTLIS